MQKLFHSMDPTKLQKDIIQNAETVDNDKFESLFSDTMQNFLDNKLNLIFSNNMSKSRKFATSYFFLGGGAPV